MKMSDLLREQEYWEDREEQARRALEYATRQVDRIVTKMSEMQESGNRHLQIVRNECQVILLHGGETE